MASLHLHLWRSHQSRQRSPDAWIVKLKWPLITSVWSRTMSLTVIGKILKTNGICIQPLIWTVKNGLITLRIVSEDFMSQIHEPGWTVVLDNLEKISRMRFHEGQVSSCLGLFWRFCQVYCLCIQNTVFLYLGGPCVFHGFLQGCCCDQGWPVKRSWAVVLALNSCVRTDTEDTNWNCPCVLWFSTENCQWLLFLHNIVSLKEQHGCELQWCAVVQQDGV